MVSIGYYDLCLSCHVAKDRSQKLINSFVPSVFVLLLLLISLWLYNRIGVRILLYIDLRPGQTCIPKTVEVAYSVG